jgi:hypothetical protein
MKTRRDKTLVFGGQLGIIPNRPLAQPARSAAWLHFQTSLKNSYLFRLMRKPPASSKRGAP